MSKPLRKSVTLDLVGHEVTLEITMRVIAVIEKVYDANLDHVIAFELGMPMRVKRSKVAECIAEWIAIAGVEVPLKRREILDAVMGSDVPELNKYIGALQAAALYCLRGADGQPRINDQEMELLLAGKDVPPRARAITAEAGEDTEKKAEPATASSTPATISPSDGGA